MKNPKLHTVNKWNIPAFMPKGNLFAGTIPGQSSQMVRVNLTPMTPTTPNNMTSQNQYADYLAAINKPAQLTDAALQTADLQAKNAAMAQYMAGNRVENPFNFKEAFSADSLKSAAGAAMTGVSGAVGGTLNNIISGGYSSGAGSTIGSVGRAVGTAVSAANPVLGSIINIASDVVGGAANALLGEKVDTARLGLAKESISKMKTLNTDVNTLDDIGDLEATGSIAGIYKGGLLNKSAKRHQGQLEKEFKDAKDYAFAGMENSADNVMQDQINKAEATSFAFGGPFDMMGSDMGAIGYGLMSDYLTMKKQEAAAKNRASGMVQTPVFMNGFAIGGDLQTHGSDWSTGLTHISAGQSHELNPNDGVQVGVDNEGIPNLVEEGEVIYNDYVYSQRILIDQATKEKFHIGKKREISYADLAKKLESEIKERPNDPVSKAGFEKQMAELAEQQERQKQEMEAEKAKAAFEALSPEEQTAVMQRAAQEEQMAQQAAVEQEAMAQQPSPEETQMMQQQQAMQADGTQAMVGQEPQVMAEGGHLFPTGGYLWDKFWEPVNEYSKQKGNTKGKYQPDKKTLTKKQIQDLEDSDAYKAFTDYILNSATPEERLKYFRWIDDNTGRNRVYTNEKGELLDGWQDKYRAARYDGLYGIQHYTPEFEPNLGASTDAAKAVVATPKARVFHAMDGDLYDGYIEGELDPKYVGAETRKETLPNGDTVIYHAPATKAEKNKEDEKKSLKPKYQHTMFGLSDLGPVTALGMQAMGIGRPDVGSLYSAISGAGNFTRANWMPIDTRVKNTHDDPWFYTMPILAQANATDSAIDNSGVNQGSKNAARLANSYNTTIALGNAARQQLDSNYDRDMKARQLRGTLEEANQREFGTTSRFNASAYNEASRAAAQARLNAAAQAMDADAGWYNSLYGNIGNIFKNFEAHRQENARHNMIADMAANGLFGVMSPDTHIAKDYLTWAGAYGGKTKRKKNKKGLTY